MWVFLGKTARLVRSHPDQTTVCLWKGAHTDLVVGSPLKLGMWMLAQMPTLKPSWKWVDRNWHSFVRGVFIMVV